MKLVATFGVVLLILSSFVFAAGCGDKAEQEETTAKATTTTSQSEVEPSLPTEAVPYAPEIVEAGFEPVHYDYFPAGVSDRQGKMVVYRSATGGDDGGLIFVQELGPNFEWMWHWYFEDVSPRSATYAEINGDGLWDIRVTKWDGGTHELLQDDAFTLAGAAREDKIALNAKSSASSEGHPLWYCFDGDPSTAWVSDMQAKEKPFVEVTSPLKLVDGILTIKALKENQPRKCDILADGKKVQSIDLEETADKQLVQLKPEVKTAKKIRLVFKSCHGKCTEVAIAELAIK